MPTEWEREFAGQSIAVLGLGVSNTPLARCLVASGARVTVYDRKSPTELGDDALALARLGCAFVSGDGCFDRIEGDRIVRSPGIRPDLPGILDAVARGAELTSEIELFLTLTPTRVVAVTGSDGKTTTTTLTHLILSKTEADTGRRVFLGGNIGKPLFDQLPEMREGDVTVAELSSFQLMTAGGCPRPEVCAVTNLSPNHLNWHTDYREYIEAKCNVFRHPGCRRVVLNAENADSAVLAREVAERDDLELTLFSSSRTSYGEIVPDGWKNCRAVYVRDGVVYFCDGKSETAVLRVGDIYLPGRHNLENYMTAIALCAGETDSEKLSRAVSAIAREFHGVEHRLETVRVLDGVTYINSSIDSSPSRTHAALSAMTLPAVVICGGRDKHVPFDTLAEDLCRHALSVVLTGEAREQIQTALLRCPSFDPEKLHVEIVPDFDGAVATARELAPRGSAVLLSPACTSFDAFRNFEERGRHFKELVNGWTSRE